MEDLLIRYENFGPLFWSRSNHSYFILLNTEGEIFFNRAIEAKKIANIDDQIPLDFLSELDDLGFNGIVREITTTSNLKLNAPLDIYFDYTWRCNLKNKKCGKDSFCYARNRLGNITMSPQIVQKVIRELYDWGVMMIHLAGGEPTIDEDGIANYLDTANKFGLYLSIATNGLLLTPTICEIILRNNLKSVSIGLDGADEETHSKVRGKGLFEKTVQNIKNITEMRNSCKSNTAIALKPTFDFNKSRKELEDLILLGIDLGLDEVKFSNPERCLFHSKGYYGQNSEKYYKALNMCLELKEKYQRHINILIIGNPLSGCCDIGLPNMEGCIGGQELLTINPNASITPCLTHQRNLGVLYNDYCSLKQFWNNSKLLHNYWKELKSPNECKDCDFFSKCRSGSVTRRIVEVGEINEDMSSGNFYHAKDPLCPAVMKNNYSNFIHQNLNNLCEYKYFKQIHVIHSL
jgi:radical SAM protein with 4Fe4S-binding SPASM domain